MTTKIAAFLLAAGLACGAAAQTAPTIERLAPANSVVVLGVKDVKASMERVKSTRLWELLNSPDMAEARADVMKDLQEQMESAMEELGVEKDSLVPPQGPAGLAIFPAMDEGGVVTGPAFLLFADYGTDIEKTAALVAAGLEKAKNAGHIEHEIRDVAGHELHVIRPIRSAADEAAGADEPDGFGEEGADDDGLFPMPGADNLLADLERLYYVRHENVLMLSSDLAAATGALESFTDDAPRGVAGREEFKAAIEQVGECDAYGALLMRDLTRLLASGDEMGMAMMMWPMIQPMIGDVQSLGYGVRIGGAAAMTEQTLVAYMPSGKTGLSSLVAKEAPRAELPAFVGSNAISYASVNVDPGRVMEVIRMMIRMNPMFAAEGQQMIAEIEPTVAELSRILGPDMHIVATANEPMTAEGLGSLLALRCRDTQAFENFLAGMGAQIGLTPRDFLGQRIYSVPREAIEQMMPMPTASAPELAIGIGTNFVFSGPARDVEQALRAAGQAAPAGLAQEPAFARALGALPADPAVAWGFMNTIDMARAGELKSSLQASKEIEQLRQWDPDLARQMEEDLANDDKPEIDYQLMSRYVGPSVWTLRSNEKGFVAKLLQFAAVENEP